MTLDLEHEVNQLSFGATAYQLAAVERAQPSAVVPAVFHSLEPVDEALRDGLVADDSNDAAHDCCFRSKSVRNPNTRHLGREGIDISSDEYPARRLRGGEDDRVGDGQPAPLSAQLGSTTRNLLGYFDDSEMAQKAFRTALIVGQTVCEHLDPADPA
jgi:hypothetical protein